MVGEYREMELFCVEKPPEDSVVKAWHTESKAPIPAIHSDSAAITVRPQYIPTIILAVVLIWGENFSFWGPVTSAAKRDIPPPIKGMKEIKITTIPTPPIQFVMLRQKSMPLGRASTSETTVAEVVVKPLRDSKKASKNVGR